MSGTDQRELPCPECGGAGWVAATRPACCGNLSPGGGCWGGCAVEEQYQAQCDECGGSGRSREAQAEPPQQKDHPND